MKTIPFPVFTESQCRGEAADRLIASETPHRWWEEAPTFDGLDALMRDQEAAEMLLRGLTGHYAKAVSQGRLRQWASAAHAIVDLLADPFANQHRSPTDGRTGGPDA